MNLAAMKPTRPREAKVLNLDVRFRRLKDGLWSADIPTLPGLTGTGRSRKDALQEIEALALRAIAHKLEHTKLQ